MRPDPDVDYNGELATSYDSGRDITLAAEQTWLAATTKRFGQAKLVVDVGAGTGRFARRIAGNFDAMVAAVEPAHGMRSNAKDEAAVRSVTWLGGTAEDLPLRSNSADVLWSAFATHYYDLPAAAQEFARVIRTDGHVLIWHAFSEVFDDLEWFKWFPEARTIDESRMPTRTQVTEAFEAAGFDVVEHSIHKMLITHDLHALADRLSHRSISTLNLISDQSFDTGLANLRAHAATVPPEPVFASNVLLVLKPHSGST